MRYVYFLAKMQFSRQIYSIFAGKNAQPQLKVVLKACDTSFPFIITSGPTKLFFTLVKE